MDYIVKTDNQQEDLLQRAVDDWIKANTVTVNVITKDEEGKEITTPTITPPKITKADFIQKLLNDKTTEVYIKVEAEKVSAIPEKIKKLPPGQLKKVMDILDGK